MLVLSRSDSSLADDACAQLQAAWPFDAVFKTFAGPLEAPDGGHARDPCSDGSLSLPARASTLSITLVI